MKIVILILLTHFFIFTNAKALQEQKVSNKIKTQPNFTIEEQSYLKNKNSIKMCVDPDWEPYEKIDKNGNHIGIAADFIKLIETKIETKIELIKTISWDQSLDYVKENRCEILSFLNETPERLKFLNFTPVLYEEPEVIVTKNNVPFINGLDSLDNKKVGIVKGYTTDEYLKDENPKIQIIYTKNSEEGIKMVSEGKIYANLNSLLGTANLIRKHNLIDVKISGKTNMFNEYRVGIIKDDLLLHSILSKAVYSISKQEKENIINNWMAVHIEQDIDYSVLRKILGVVALLIIFLLYRDYTIRKVNKQLEEKMQLQIQQMQEKDNMLQQQSKLAQMGEMVNMIAHQWRQPLGAISSTIIAIDMSLSHKKFYLESEQNDEVYKKNLISKLDKISQYVQVLSTTIDDFRNFFKPDKHKQLISLQEPISMALNIVEPSMKNTYYIEITTDYKSQEKVNIFKNEFMQVILNILKNSEDNFKERAIKKPIVHIEVNETSSMHIVKIYDNGGGIEEKVLEKIFDPYFSTKKSIDGTGIGLYMSKIIIEKHHNGKIIAYNYKDGICFEIQLQK